jgi:hexulose-6-phosphate isomerase
VSKTIEVSGRIGFMQGRLSPIFEGRIQIFPWSCWQQEFAAAEKLGFGLMEWTLDQDRLYENPLLTATGQAEIRALCERHKLRVSSLTGDCFMQAPFWKAEGARRDALQRDFIAVAEACAAVGIGAMVVPLVDNGRIDSAAQEDALVEFLQTQAGFLASRKLQVVFESDYQPAELARFIARLDPDLFGVNYDIGNSASLEFDPAEEFSAYGDRILNVHVKDRVAGGTTVPLGTGNADFETVFAALGKRGYKGKYILQTARAADNDHAGVLRRYRDMTIDWMTRHAA